ncbi:MAG: hypothetical protein ACI8P9_005848 [Parasphingorhabdus sp.]|jgi:hypothetical protein
MKSQPLKIKTIAATAMICGITALFSFQIVQAQRVPPSEHIGVKVVNLGVFRSHR